MAISTVRASDNEARKIATVNDGPSIIGVAGIRHDSPKSGVKTVEVVPRTPHEIYFADQFLTTIAASRQREM